MKKEAKKTKKVTAYAKTARQKGDKPISPAYKEIDSDLARDNLENDIPSADLQDL